METTYILAILVKQEVITVDEARKLLKAMRENVVNANLGEMISKVDKALATKVEEIKTVDAKEFLKSN